MKVILTQDVRGQGKRGQMIDVSDGYARNFLLPRKLAQEGDRRQHQHHAHERQGHAGAAGQGARGSA